MARAGKRRRSQRGGSLRRAERGQPRDPFEDVFESGGELFLAVGYTPGGAPFGPRVEILDGEFTFPDELAIDLDMLDRLDDDGAVSDMPSPPQHNTPY